MPQEPMQGMQLISQFVRLLIALSSGAVLLVGTFLRDVFPNPSVNWALLLAVAGFAMCVVFSLGYFLKLAGMVMFMEANPGRDLRTGWTTQYLWQGALVSFFLAFGLLAFFIIWNLSARISP